jgi:hypothetical protein
MSIGFFAQRTGQRFCRITLRLFRDAPSALLAQTDAFGTKGHGIAAVQTDP